jgi:Rrf2 family protein
MKLTRASSYALHAVAYMAAQKTHDVPIASHKIADARGIPERFLLKVLKPLVGAQVLMSIKGPNGGYQLARAPGDISLLEIIEAVDGPIRGLAAVNDKEKEKMLNGPLHKKLQAVCTETADAVKSLLTKVKLTDLLSTSKK